MISRHTSRSIDVVRGMAALGVVWGHAVSGMHGLDLNGAFWVWIFLPISGYLVGKGFEPCRSGTSPSGYGRFLWNRALRIVPLAWVALALGLAIEIVGATHETPGASAARQFLFMNRGNNMSLSGPLWTVAAEVQFYVVAIVGFLMIRRFSRWADWVWWATLVAIVYYLGLTTGQPRTLAGNLPFFAFGLVLSSGRYDALVRLRPVAKGVLVLVPIAVAWYLQNWHVDYFWYWSYQRTGLFGGAALCALVVAFVTLTTELHERTPARAAWRPGQAVIGALAWCGFYTYGIYVYHSVLAKANTTFLHLPPGLAHLAWLTGAVAVAPLSYRLIERPIMRFKARNRSAKGALIGVPATLASSAD